MIDREPNPRTRTLSMCKDDNPSETPNEAWLGNFDEGIGFPYHGSLALKTPWSIVRKA